MSDFITFKAHFAGFKYLKSNHIWRIELDLFEEDKALVPDQTKLLEKIVTVRMSEWEDPLDSNDLNDLINDPTLQVAFGTSDAESTIKAIEQRTSVNLSELDKESLCNIINTIKDSLK